MLLFFSFQKQRCDLHLDKHWMSFTLHKNIYNVKNRVSKFEKKTIQINGVLKHFWDFFDCQNLNVFLFPIEFSPNKHTIISFRGNN